jgi:hypothetical protein
MAVTVTKAAQRLIESYQEETGIPLRLNYDVSGTRSCWSMVCNNCNRIHDCDALTASALESQRWIFARFKEHKACSTLPADEVARAFGEDRAARMSRANVISLRYATMYEGNWMLPPRPDCRHIKKKWHPSTSKWTCSDCGVDVTEPRTGAEWARSERVVEPDPPKPQVTMSPLTQKTKRRITL